eukprot:scaffold180020_cov17-Tisochrysis_lutea.AAC.2
MAPRGVQVQHHDLRRKAEKVQQIVTSASSSASRHASHRSWLYNWKPLLVTRGQRRAHLLSLSPGTWVQPAALAQLLRSWMWRGSHGSEEEANGWSNVSKQSARSAQCIQGWERSQPMGQRLEKYSLPCKCCTAHVAAASRSLQELANTLHAVKVQAWRAGMALCGIQGQPTQIALETLGLHQVRGDCSALLFLFDVRGVHTGKCIPRISKPL